MAAGSRGKTPEERTASLRGAPKLTGIGAIGGSSAFQRGATQYDAGRFAAAADAFFEDSEEQSNEQSAQLADYALAVALAEAGLWHSATWAAARILEQGPSHSRYTQAIELLVVATDHVGDLVIGALLDREYNDRFAVLPPATVEEVNVLVARASLRRGRREDARDFLQAVTRTSPRFALAQALAATLEAERSPDAALRQADAALVAASDHRDGQAIRELAQLTTARVRFAKGDFALALDRYRAIAEHGGKAQSGRLSPALQALHEGAWAALLNGQPGEAVSMLDRLERDLPQALFLDTAYLRAAIAIASCRPTEAIAIADAWRARSKEARTSLGAALASANPSEAARALLAPGRSPAPAAVVDWVRDDPRIERMSAYVRSSAAEAARTQAQLPRGALADTLEDMLAQQQGAAETAQERLVTRRLREADLQLEFLEGMIDVVRLEAANAEAQHAETGACSP